MAKVFQGIAGKLHISDPELFIDNQARGRSGHMTHAMLEYAPGHILAFNANSSGRRCCGHSAFGWVEYHYSHDYGKTWSETYDLPYSRKELLDGVFSISIEKAVICNDVITIFALRNSQSSPLCCTPWSTVMTLQSFDHGKTWTEATEMAPYAGRLYDAVVHDGIIYALLFCNEEHVGVKPEHLYRLYSSRDNGKSFQLASVIDIDNIGHAYGALQFRPDGSLVAYANNIWNGYLLAESVSEDCGLTWKRRAECRLSLGIRNIQISRLDGAYVMHGRAYQDAQWGKGFVVYTSKDALNWDDGFLLEPEKTSCYYSNNLLLKKPDGTETLLVQYSDKYGDTPQNATCVNVMHLFMRFES